MAWFHRFSISPESIAIEGISEDVLKIAIPSDAERKKSGFRLPLWWPWLAKRIFNLSYRRRFYQRLRIITLGGIPLEEGVQEMRQQALETRQKAFWQMFDDVHRKMSRGAAFAETLRDWCPPTEALLIGSASGGNKSMVNAIDKVLTLQDGISDMRTAIMTVMLEPVIILLGSYGLVIWMATSFLHQILSVARGISTSQFTGLAHQLVVVGEFGGGFKSLIPPALFILLVVVIVMSMPRWTGTLRKYTDDIPPWSIYRAIQGAAWMQSFAMLADAGMTYDDILQETARMGTPWLRERLYAARGFLMRGMPVGAAFWATGYNFPSKEVAQDLKAFGARTGFESALGALANEWLKQTVQRVKSASIFMGLFSMLASTASILWIFEASNALVSQLTQIMRSMAGG